MITIITVKISKVPVSSDVDSRAYVNGQPLMGIDASDKSYHLGQISSSVTWAKHDMLNHFKNEYDRLFPQGWELVFETQ